MNCLGLVATGNTEFKRFRGWIKHIVFKRIFDALPGPDREYATIFKVRHHGQRAKGETQSQAIGKSKGGKTESYWINLDKILKSSVPARSSHSNTAISVVMMAPPVSSIRAKA